jgi:hypothetical protein
MIVVESDPETLGIIKRQITHHDPAVQFSGNLQIGRLQIGLDKGTAEFIVSIIKAVRDARKKEVQVSVGPSNAPSGITREFLNGYFRRR